MIEYVDESPQELTEDEILYFAFRSDVSSVEVDSSNIVAVGYTPEKSIMHIKFASGATYRYTNVLFSEFWALVNAESAGRYFATHIRNNKDITCIKEG